MGKYIMKYSPCNSGLQEFVHGVRTQILCEEAYQLAKCFRVYAQLLGRPRIRQRLKYFKFGIYPHIPADERQLEFLTQG